MLTKKHTQGYILQWLDTLVSVTLRPVKSKIPQLLPGDLEKLRGLVINEKNKVQSVIMSTIFNLKDEAKISCAVKKYYSSLAALLEQALKDRSGISDKYLKQALDVIILSIDELLSLIEQRFTSFLSMDERVPATYLALFKKECSKRLEAITSRVSMYETFQPAFDIVQKDLEIFLGNTPDQSAYKFREIFYVKDLCLELEQVELVSTTGVFSKLDGLLICMNFNSKSYIHNLTQRVTEHTDTIEPASEKMERLLLNFKLFKQFYKKPGIAFNIKDASLHKQIDNWFSQEIFYLENQINYSNVPIRESGKAQKEKSKEKILAKLSVDQMALILRAADDVRIIMARSLSSVFKNIAPHLSTPQKEDISFDSMRSKAYSAEFRDKEIAIRTLQQLIDKIKEY